MHTVKINTIICDTLVYSNYECPIATHDFQHLALVPYEIPSDSDEEDEQRPLMASTPKQPLVSTDASSGALICPVQLEDNEMERGPVQQKDGQCGQEDNEKEGSLAQLKGNQHQDNEKDRCPSNICKMKRPNSRTWWVSCSTCGQWFHIRCVNLTKEKA